MLSHSANAQHRHATRMMPAGGTGLFGGAAGLIATPMATPRNGEIYGENEPADFFYQLVEGTVRTVKVLTDGRRQIGAFYLPGDVFGLETGETHAYSAEAVTPVRVMMIRRSAVESLTAHDAEVARSLWIAARQELERMQAHTLLLIKTAQERVAGFLLEMAKRCHTGPEVQLPMSRQDIADHLGLTIETVSRTLTSLEHSAAIGLPSARRVVLRNHAALRRLNA